MALIATNFNLAITQICFGQKGFPCGLNIGQRLFDARVLMSPNKPCTSSFITLHCA